MLIVIALVALLSASFPAAAAQQTTEENQDIVESMLKNIDSSIIAIRKGGDATGALQSAWVEYSKIRPSVENVDDNLDDKIEQAFNQLVGSPSEDGIRALRDDLSLAASKIGASVSVIYEHAIFVILGIAVLFSLVITLITRRVVDWKKVKQIKAEVNAWRKELQEAQRKKDMKRLYKLQQDQKRILGLQGKIMMSSFKPMILYIVPYILLWSWLSGLYSGWVVAWLPFTLPLPIVGTFVSFGFLPWFLISYFGFSSIWRKLLIGD
jgi:uncharacterized membrane protein (DUF106 family)